MPPWGLRQQSQGSACARTHTVEERTEAALGVSPVQRLALPTWRLGAPAFWHARSEHAPQGPLLSGPGTRFGICMRRPLVPQADLWARTPGTSGTSRRVRDLPGSAHTEHMRWLRLFPSPYAPCATTASQLARMPSACCPAHASTLPPSIFTPAGRTAGCIPRHAPGASCSHPPRTRASSRGRTAPQHPPPSHCAAQQMPCPIQDATQHTHTHA